MSMPAVTLLIIDAAGNLVGPIAPMRAEPDTHVVWLLFSLHATDTFTVEVTDFKIKETGVAGLPVGGPHSRKLKPGEFDTIAEKTKKKGSFGGGGPLPFTTYKYSVNVTNTTAGTATVTLDPDLDIPPP